MSKKQRFDNSLFDTAEVMEVLSIYFGVVDIAEYSGNREKKYPNTWSRRTLIKASRCEYSTAGYGLGYGADWKGKKIIHRQDGSCEVRKGHAIKSEVQEYEAENRVPGYAMKIAASQIRQANMFAWIQIRNGRAESKMATVVPFKKAAGDYEM